jgi:hypothetical protein
MSFIALDDEAKSQPTCKCNAFTRTVVSVDDGTRISDEFPAAAAASMRGQYSGPGVSDLPRICTHARLQTVIFFSKCTISSTDDGNAYQQFPKTMYLLRQYSNQVIKLHDHQPHVSSPVLRFKYHRRIVNKA